MNTALFYKDKPLFGLDIGFKTVKVMQIESSSQGHTATGYGAIEFDESAIDNGVITNFDAIAKPIHELFSSRLTGEISTRRVAISVPASRTFSRILSLPILAKKDIGEAVRLEAEQYIPVSINDLYIDYTIIHQDLKTISVLAVAVPKRIIDSYLRLCQILNLEPVVMETTTEATNRLFQFSDTHSIPTVLIDFGSISTDISVYDKFLAVTGTVGVGGGDITKAIAEKLGSTEQEAYTIKVKYGLNLSKKQSEIVSAVQPLLQKTLKEVKRMIRYYEDRSDTSGKIGQIVTFGGGSNVPGLSGYFTDNLRVPVRMCDPWEKINFKNLNPPSPVERSMYLTVASLALIKPSEAWA